jgi:RND family efflux transporter MFP subunit
MSEQSAVFPEQNAVNKGPKKKSKKLIVITLIVIAIVAFLSLTREKPENKPKKIIKKGITTIKVGENRTKNALITKTVKIISEDETEVVAEYSGRIVKDNFEIGDQVYKGQVLAVFNQSPLENRAVINVSSARNSVDFARENLDLTKKIAEKSYKTAKNDVEVAKIRYKRIKDGKDQSMDKKTAKELLEQARRRRDQTKAQGDQQIEAAQNSLNQAQSGLDMASLEQGKTVIKAPSDGVITSKRLNKNSYINMGTIIANISSGDELEANTFLSQKEIQGLEPGDGIDLICKGQKETVSGLAQIKNISSIPNEKNLRYAVVLEFFPSRDAYSCIGSNTFIKAQFSIPVLEEDKHYFIPLSAVKIGQTKNTVFIIKEEKAELRDVIIGEVFGDFVEILDGIKIGEIIADEGSNNLRNGDEVEERTDLDY